MSKETPDIAKWLQKVLLRLYQVVSGICLQRSGWWRAVATLRDMVGKADKAELWKACHTQIPATALAEGKNNIVSPDIGYP